MAFADAAVEGFSSHGNDGRARRGSHSLSSAAASNMQLVSATGDPKHVSWFQTPALAVSSGWSPLLHSSTIPSLYNSRISSRSFLRAACNGLHACSREARYNARFSRGRLCVWRWLVPFTVSNSMCRTTRTRALCVEVSMQCLLYITRDPYSMKESEILNKTTTHPCALRSTYRILLVTLRGRTPFQ